MIDFKLLPRIPAIGELGMEWFALPGVSARLFEAGGIQFPAAPFSGWYSLPEVGTRNLLDRQRYNMSEEIGRAMGLDVSTNQHKPVEGQGQHRVQRGRAPQLHEGRSGDGGSTHSGLVTILLTCKFC